MSMKKLLLTFLIAILALTQAEARSVRNRSVVLTQPDGQTLPAVINGDEFSRSIRDLQGHALIQDSEGTWCYAAFAPDGTKFSSGYRAGKEAPAYILSASMASPLLHIRPKDRRLLRDGHQDFIKPALAPGTKQKKHCMILLVDFKDKKMTYTRADFERMVRQKGYSLNGAQGSVNDYFNDQFQGDIEFTYEISDIITLDNDCAWYFGNKDDSDQRPDHAVAEACRKASAAGVNFSGCDDDGDGEVDNVFLFVAGKDEADGGGEDCVWSHMHYLEFSDDAGIANLVIDGKRINNYAISTEYRQNSDRTFTFASIGTFCHEYSHALGLRDLYDTDYAGSGGYGNGLWYTTGLMDGGNMNNDGNTPPHYNAVDYHISGIGQAEELKVGTYTLEPISRGRRFLKMETGTPGEFYLIECRDNKGWDAYIGGKGLLIYHIDRSKSPAGRSDRYEMAMTAEQRWYYNEVNSRPSHECAQLIPATPGISAYTADGYLTGNTSQIFYPSKTNDAFTSLSTPAFVFWNGTESPLAITDISMEGDNVTFTVSKMGNVSVPEIRLGKTEIFQDAAIIQWEAEDPGYEGTAYVTWGEIGQEETVEIEVQPYARGRYALVLDGLKTMTSYSAGIRFKEMGLSSKEAQVNFTTKRIYDGYPFIFMNTVPRNGDGSVPEGSMVPLRVYNARNAASVDWYMGNTKISVGSDGYYHITSSGNLKAIIHWKDGTKDVLMKEIILK